MNLTESPELVQWLPTHYVFIEKAGPFMKVAPEAWGLAHRRPASPARGGGNVLHDV